MSMFTMMMIPFYFTLGILAIILVTKTITIVPQSEVYIVERLGKYKETLNPGLHFVVPFIDNVSYKNSLRTMRLDSEPQPVITKDNVSMGIDTVIFYKITDPIKSTYEVDDLEMAIEAITSTTIRDVIGSMELDKTLHSRDAINTKLSVELDKATDAWGVKIERVEVKDIIPPNEIKTAMESQMRAERSKRASILEAEGKREAAIKTAEGQKESEILKAEGQKESQILESEGQAQAIERIAKAEKEEISLVYRALKEAELDDKILNLESIKAMQEIAKSDNKMIVPFESQSLMGAISSIASLKEEKSEE